MPAKRFLGGALVVYAWPLLLAIVSGLLAETLTSPQHIAVPLAFGGGLALGVMLGRIHLQRHPHRYRPHLVAIDTSEADRAATFSRTC